MAANPLRPTPVKRPDLRLQQAKERMFPPRWWKPSLLHGKRPRKPRPHFIPLLKRFVSKAAHLRRQLWVAPNSNKSPHVIKTNSTQATQPPSWDSSQPPPTRLGLSQRPGKETAPDRLPGGPKGQGMPGKGLIDGNIYGKGSGTCPLYPTGGASGAFWPLGCTRFSPGAKEARGGIGGLPPRLSVSWLSLPLAVRKWL